MDVVLTPTTIQSRVQFAVLLQFGEHGAADPTTTTAICPGADQRDLEAALEYLLDEGTIEGPTWRLESLVALAEGGLLALTALGQQQLIGDEA
jgi:hypothetical protein